MRNFDSGDAEKLFNKAVRGLDLTPEDAVYYGMLRELLTGATREVARPAGTKEADWGPKGVGTVGLTPSQRQSMYNDVRDLVRLDPTVSNVLVKFMVHVCGNGPTLSLQPTVTPEGEKKEHPKSVIMREIFEDGEAASLMRLLVAETLKNGNIFALHLPLDSGFLETVGNEHVGYPQLRVLLPDYVEQIHRKDAWAVNGPVDYYILSKPFHKYFPKGRVPAENVTHIRLFQEWNDGVWGLSLFYQLVSELPRYVDWLAQRQWKSRADNLTYLFRLRSGAQSGKKYELPDRPMMIDLNRDKEDVKNVGLQSGSSRDASGDGYEFRLRLAQSVHLPESDVSENAQYAAQLGKFGFPARLYEYVQACLDPMLRRAFAKSIGCAPRDVIIGWPRVDTRDREAIVRETTMLEKDGDISKQEVRRVLGYSERNVDEIREELTRNMQVGPVAPPTFSMGSVGGLPGLPTAPSAPAAEPTSLTELAGLKAPSSKPAPSGAPSIPGMQMNIPASLPIKAAVGKVPGFVEALRESGAVSDLGVRAEDINDKIPELVAGAFGADYGYASEGATVFGGLDKDGNIWVLGEMVFKRVPGEEWAKAYRYIMDKYPVINKAFVGSDEPQFADALSKAGIETHIKHLGESRTRILLEARIAAGKHVYVNPVCVETLADLFPDVLEKVSGLHTSKADDHNKDAFRYMVIGLLEMSGMESVGEPQGEAIVENPQEGPNVERENNQ